MKRKEVLENHYTVEEQTKILSLEESIAKEFLDYNNYYRTRDGLDYNTLDITKLSTSEIIDTIKFDPVFTQDYLSDKVVKHIKETIDNNEVKK